MEASSGNLSFTNGLSSPNEAPARQYSRYKRDTGKRIFVNRGLQLDKIKFIGFDMDYTLAMYISPEYEALGFQLIIDHLVSIGYPADLRKYKYDNNFSVRGLWFDRLFGNLLKVDAYGNILVGVHGFRFLKPHEIENLYPSKFVHLTDRFYILNTLFNLPETYILAVVIHYFESQPEYTNNDNSTGVILGDTEMFFKSIAQDIRAAVDHVHIQGDMKKLTVENMDKYVMKDERLTLLLDRLRQGNKQVFLLTNSGWNYTDRLMDFLLTSPERHWRSYFDCVVVDAKKPLWFGEGTVFRQVDIKTGALRIGSHMGTLKQEHVYSGGSCDIFTKIMKARGKDVLYVGDHIFGDVLRSKKARGWRTFLVVPELYHELQVWTEKKSLFDQLESSEIQLANQYKDLDSVAVDQPDISLITQNIRRVTHEMDQAYCMLGSLFRSGSRQTFFASQVERFADLYGSSCCNLIYYPLFYYFRAPPMLLPHESTVAHGSVGPADDPNLSSFVQSMDRSRTGSLIHKTPLKNPNDEPRGVYERSGRARTPRQTTFVHEDTEDEDGSPITGSGSESEDKITERMRNVSFSEDNPETERRGSMGRSLTDGFDDVVVMKAQACDDE